MVFTRKRSRFGKRHCGFAYYFKHRRTIMEPKEWIRQCVEAADSVPQDDIAKADYLADLAILGGLIFDYSTIKETIMETIMQESSVIQHFLQKGIEH